MIIRVGARPATVSCVSAGRSRTARKHDPARFYNRYRYTVYVSTMGSSLPTKLSSVHIVCYLLYYAHYTLT